MATTAFYKRGFGMVKAFSILKSKYGLPKEAMEEIIDKFEMIYEQLKDNKDHLERIKEPEVSKKDFEDGIAAALKKFFS